MADEKQKIMEYFEGLEPTEDFTRRLLRLELQAEKEQQASRPKQPIPLWWRWVPVAAAAVLVSLAGFRLLHARLQTPATPATGPGITDTAPYTEPREPGTDFPEPFSPANEYVTGEELGWCYTLEQTEGRALLRITDQASGESCTLDLSAQDAAEGFYEGVGLIFGQERSYQILLPEGPGDCLLLIQKTERGSLP